MSQILTLPQNYVINYKKRGALSQNTRARAMPVISRFYGILIKMYFKEHGVPHFHAIYAEYNGVYDLQTLEMIEGDLPNRAQRLIRNWARRYQTDLQDMWQTQHFRQLPGLE